MTLHPQPSEDEVPVLGALPPEALAAKLEAMGEAATAAQIRAALAAETDADDSGEEAATRGLESFGLFDRLRRGGHPAPVYTNSASAFGYLPPYRPGSVPPAIRDVAEITPDATLNGKRIKITLLYLRAADYPGSGMHQVLFDFYARNQVPGTTEDVHFNTMFRIQEGQRAPVRGYPIFVGLTVGPGGLGFQCAVVNVLNEDDQQLIGFLDSQVFQSGLTLAAAAQPAIKPLTEMAVGLTKSLLKRHDNAKTQEFTLGLDFATLAGGAALAEGSYLVVQIPESDRVIWNWADWVYKPDTGQVVAKHDLQTLIPYNYLIFGVSRYDEGPPA